ncbi:hypothetical protein C2U70_25085 [Bradyrhizobium guangdongense]|uniref:hypothetical protein n=1 Tax=Bradyrhizobium guangdongense TaxID=1325090 RepID=UPI00112C05C0|nr:hypothetical protein [Bradyrhizobium guangdongense]TPQ31066.1 hypothetical protein C2U70_25085 [Bradyrhizobium guangdongense]
MPIASLAVSHRAYLAQADKLRALIPSTHLLAPDLKQMLSEMIALQAFYFFELAIEDIAAKLVCGTAYGDGAAPVVTHGARSIDDALSAMRTVGRARAKGILKWNKVSEINENVRHVIPNTEHFCAACRTHAARLNEIRIVRNHIAHGNAGTRADYATVVQGKLGARPTRLPRPGLFVLKEFTPGVPLLTEYVVTLGVVLKDAAKL